MTIEVESRALMTSHVPEKEADLGRSFIARSRYHLSEDFLLKIDRCLGLLTDEQIWWRANPQSNSIGNLVLHLSGNARQWIACGLGSSTDSRDRDAEFAQRETIPRQDLQALLKQTMHDVDKSLANFDVTSLLELRVIQGLEVSALEAILHVVEHFSMHTGQIILLAKSKEPDRIRFYDMVDGHPRLISEINGRTPIHPR
jgi:uncharacterized damage-inducible protein DinB